jgi:hypothetical protein
VTTRKAGDTDVAPVTGKELAAADMLTLLPVNKRWDAFFNDPRMAPSTFLTNRVDEPAQTREMYGPSERRPEEL